MNDTTVALIQARMGSSRLPGKVLEEVGGCLVLARCVAAASASRLTGSVCVATSTEAVDDPIAAWCADNGVTAFRGSETDVLSRMHGAAREANAETVVRLTADCPLHDPSVIDQVIWFYRATGADYASNTHPSTWPDGLDVEVFSMSVLERAQHEADLPSEREHVTRWMRANASQLQTETLICPLPDLHRRRWTLDTADDLARIRQIAEQFDPATLPSFLDVLAVEDGLVWPVGAEVVDASAERNSSLPAALTADIRVKASRPRSFARSNAKVDVVDALVPLASQTFSKSRVILPEGKAPLFASHGLGARVWDIDGNEYVDLVSALLAVSLGYCDPDVDLAVRRQATRGVSFSLASELEYELASTLTEIIPSAEAVRFGKNGTDATSAAVRVARAHTGRDEVVAMGYHGWQDWYIGTTTRNKGVPAHTHAGTHRVAAGDLNQIEDILKARGNSIACVMLEPVFQTYEAGHEYLAALKSLTESCGTLLVFDETVTGFRLALGGAQDYYGVVPDLSAFGKGMANGYPLSCLVGRSEIMSEMREVFLSSTFGGEAVSLAAALATVAKIQREPVIESLWRTGGALRANVNRMLAETGLDAAIALKGVDPWVGIAVHDHAGASAMEIRTYLMKEMMALGVLVTGSHNISYAHDDAIMELVSECYAMILPPLADYLANGTLRQSLDCKVVQPVFQVRSN
ncbi:MAG: aminotransferase class III-fold pyridoxal phosphate-dependent enzyme [Rhodospirillaceae bacterium]|nr:aminotransferase class III-fold pyridoxal phosphate-dependent enzyme [Rhodospirillaceae bacterium]MBT4773556.1 aminotransferase class III-fold pyridoxal phosphate-dependent enzyme [Rhodospirillaceae bacterium]MBT5357999.1 aminotransferase class III-fold pyridoxal phosphate-dependent enzyme [Rhodospirillaceae bacterium]MBT5768643.1 aminotransferase class III-fold pyridoxal phosphate-dependent enzyme [Rhodospirillaceae bacterium]MBT6309116.1 aminotransferase class III-fold pyridoxal phosphate-